MQDPPATTHSAIEAGGAFPGVSEALTDRATLFLQEKRLFLFIAEQSVTEQLLWRNIKAAEHPQPHLSTSKSLKPTDIE